MTQTMVETMERLFRSRENAGWVSMKTAFALERKRLVWMPKHARQRTGGRRFPEYWATLSDEGLAYCRRHYEKIGQRAHA